MNDNVSNSENVSAEDHRNRSKLWLLLTISIRGREYLRVIKFAHNAKQRGVEYPSVGNKVTLRGL